MCKYSCVYSKHDYDKGKKMFYILKKYKYFLIYKKIVFIQDIVIFNNFKVLKIYNQPINRCK